MRTLYVSDLDGTLLRSNERTSEYTNSVINRLTAQGMLFSYTTARSFHTAKKVTEGMTAKIPLIVYNGAFIITNVSGTTSVSLTVSNIRNIRKQICIQLHLQLHFITVDRHYIDPIYHSFGHFIDFFF